MHGLASAPHGTGCGLDQLDHTKPHSAIGLGRLRLLNAINKMFDRHAQRFSLFQLGRPHVTRTVANTHFVYLLRVVGEADAFVVDLDLLARLKIVVGNHLVAPTKQNLANLHWRKPTDVYVGNRSTVVKHGDVGKVLGRPWKVVDAPRRHGNGVLLQQMIQN